MTESIFLDIGVFQILQQVDLVTGDQTDLLLEYTGDYPLTQEEAWRITLQKWEIISELEVDGNVLLRNGGMATCGLCMYFTCWNCPVNKDGEHGNCVDTPFQDYIVARDPKRAQIFAKDELAYLKDVYAGIDKT